MKLTTNKERWALSFLENLKTFWEKAYPKDEKNINKINDLIHNICWKIKQEQEIANQI